MAQSEKQLYDTINDALAFFQSNLHTILIGKVSTVNDTTVDVEPVINRVVDGESVKLSVFTQVPPVFLCGSGSSETWPIAAGDYCLLFVTERAYDYWYNGQDFRAPIEPRMHDYSDCFALVGLKNEAGALTIPTVITRIGDMFHQGNLEHIGNVNQTGNNVQDGDYELTGNMTINGNLTVNGNINCTGTLTVPTINTQTLTASTGAKIGGKDFATHQHTGVQPGSGNTGGVL